VVALALEPGGRRFATGAIDGEVLLWEVEGPRVVAVLDAPRSEVTALAYSPTGALAIAGGWSGRVEVWRGERLEHTWQPHTARAMALAWSPDGERLATAGTDRAAAPSPKDDGPAHDAVPSQQAPVVRVWEGEARVAQWEGLGGKTPYALALSPDGAWGAAGGNGPEVWVWDAKTGAKVATIPAPGEVGHLRFGEGDRLWVVGGDGALEARGPSWAAGPVRAELAAPSRAAWAEPEAEGVWAGGFEDVQRLGWDGAARGRVAGRAYAVAFEPAAREAWVALGDRLLRLNRDGQQVGEPWPLRAP
jgi:hypothetical protein